MSTNIANGSYIVKATFLILSFLVIVVFSCEEPDPFPNEPNIWFEDLRFVPNENGNDSLVLEFGFEDGDGDLGLESSDTIPPFHAFYYVVDSLVQNGNVYSFRPIRFNADTLYKPVYTLPQNGTSVNDLESYSLELSDMPALDCQYYEITETDTLLIVQNELRHNFYVRFFRNRGNGFEEYRYEDIDAFGCGINFNGRFPVLDSDNIGTSLQGTIKYSMTSIDFTLPFQEFDMYLEFFILDRAGNSSMDTIRTPIATLNELSTIGND